MPRAPDARDARDEHEPEEGRGRGRAKRAAAELYDLGLELIALPSAELDALELPEKLRDAIDLARTITAHGGLARQRNYVAKLLRKVESGAIREALARRELERKLAAREFHRIEQWRDRLVDEGEPALAALLALQPGLEAAALRALVAQARAERDAGRAPAAARELFRRVRDVLAAAPGAGA